MRATEYDGGIFVTMNGVLLPEDGSGMSQNEVFRYRYSIRSMSDGRWAVLSFSNRLSKEVDCFISCPAQSARAPRFTDDTTWHTAEEAFEHLQMWKIRERLRCMTEGFRESGSLLLSQKIHLALEGIEKAVTDFCNESGISGDLSARLSDAREVLKKARTGQ